MEDSSDNLSDIFKKPDSVLVIEEQLHASESQESQNSKVTEDSLSCTNENSDTLSHIFQKPDNCWPSSTDSVCRKRKPCTVPTPNRSALENDTVVLKNKKFIFKERNDEVSSSELFGDTPTEFAESVVVDEPKKKKTCLKNVAHNEVSLAGQFSMCDSADSSVVLPKKRIIKPANGPTECSESNDSSIVTSQSRILENSRSLNTTKANEGSVLMQRQKVIFKTLQNTTIVDLFNSEPNSVCESAVKCKTKIKRFRNDASHQKSICDKLSNNSDISEDEAAVQTQKRLALFGEKENLGTSFDSTGSLCADTITDKQLGGFLKKLDRKRNCSNDILDLFDATNLINDEKESEHSTSYETQEHEDRTLSNDVDDSECEASSQNVESTNKSSFLESATNEGDTSSLKSQENTGSITLSSEQHDVTHDETLRKSTSYVQQTEMSHNCSIEKNSVHAEELSLPSCLDESPRAKIENEFLKMDAKITDVSTEKCEASMELTLEERLSESSKLLTEEAVSNSRQNDYIIHNESCNNLLVEETVYENFTIEEVNFETTSSIQKSNNEVESVCVFDVHGSVVKNRADDIENIQISIREKGTENVDKEKHLTVEKESEHVENVTENIRPSLEKEYDEGKNAHPDVFPDAVVEEPDRLCLLEVRKTKKILSSSSTFPTEVDHGNAHPIVSSSLPEIQVTELYSNAMKEFEKSPPQKSIVDDEDDGDVTRTSTNITPEKLFAEDVLVEELQFSEHVVDQPSIQSEYVTVEGNHESQLSMRDDNDKTITEQNMSHALCSPTQTSNSVAIKTKINDETRILHSATFVATTSNNSLRDDQNNTYTVHEPRIRRDEDDCTSTTLSRIFPRPKTFDISQNVTYVISQNSTPLDSNDHNDMPNRTYTVSKYLADDDSVALKEKAAFKQPAANEDDVHLFSVNSCSLSDEAPIERRVTRSSARLSASLATANTSKNSHQTSIRESQPSAELQCTKGSHSEDEKTVSQKDRSRSSVKSQSETEETQTEENETQLTESLHSEKDEAPMADESQSNEDVSQSVEESPSENEQTSVEEEESERLEEQDSEEEEKSGAEEDESQSVEGTQPDEEESKRREENESHHADDIEPSEGEPSAANLDSPPLEEVEKTTSKIDENNEEEGRSQRRDTIQSHTVANIEDSGSKKCDSEENWDLHLSKDAVTEESRKLDVEKSFAASLLVSREDNDAASSEEEISDIECPKSDEENESTSDSSNVFKRPDSKQFTRSRSKLMSMSLSSSRKKSLNSTSTQSSNATISLVQKMCNVESTVQPVRKFLTGKAGSKKKRKPLRFEYDSDDDELNDSIRQLPKKPNFPKYHLFGGKLFYDRIIAKMESKYGIRTNYEACRVSEYLWKSIKLVEKSTDVDFINKKVGEMKCLMRRKQIVHTHYDFFLFCLQQFPPIFNQKAVPMALIKSSVVFDINKAFDPISDSET